MPKKRKIAIRESLYQQLKLIAQALDETPESIIDLVVSDWLGETNQDESEDLDDEGETEDEE